MSRLFTIVFLWLISAVAPSALAGDVQVVRTLGGEDDDLFLHNPMSVQLADDGTWFLTNAGECQVWHLDAHWNLLKTFGRCGEGPGEFQNPRAMVLYRDEVWVFGAARITVFGQDGVFRRSLVPGLQYQWVTLLEGRLAAVMGVGEKSAAFLTDAGEVDQAFGTSCPDDFFESFKTCRNQQILPSAEGRCLLLNPLSGKVWLVDGSGQVAWEKRVVGRDEQSRMARSDDGETVTLSVVFVTGHAGRGPAGHYWFTIPGQEEGDPMSIRVTDGLLNPLGEDILLPAGINGYEIFFTPEGLVGLVSTSESVVHLCRIERP